MSKSLPQVQQVKKKGWLSRLFSRPDVVESTPDLPAVMDGAEDQNKAKALENMRKLAEGIHAKTANKCRTNRYVSVEAGDLDGGVYLYAFRNPLAGTWNINRYTYVPDMGFRCEPVKEGICYWDVLEYCGTFEGAQKIYGKTPAFDSLEDEPKAPHYAEMAEAEGIPLDLEGLPLLVLEGEIISPGHYDKKAVEVARRGAAAPPAPDTSKKQIRQIVRSAFNDVQAEPDDLQRILKKSGVVKDFRLLNHFLTTAYQECKKLHENGFSYTHMRTARKDLSSAVEMLNELAGKKDCPVDVKAQLKSIRVDAEFGDYVFFAKLTYKEVMAKQDSFWSGYFEEYYKKLEGLRTDMPALDFEAVRTYIMDYDEPAELPRSIGVAALLFKDVQDVLQDNVEKDNRMSVQRACRPK